MVVFLKYTNVILEFGRKEGINTDLWGTLQFVVRRVSSVILLHRAKLPVIFRDDVTFKTWGAVKVDPSVALSAITREILRGAPTHPPISLGDLDVALVSMYLPRPEAFPPFPLPLTQTLARAETPAQSSYQLLTVEVCSVIMMFTKHLPSSVPYLDSASTKF